MEPLLTLLAPFLVGLAPQHSSIFEQVNEDYFIWIGTIYITKTLHTLLVKRRYSRCRHPSFHSFVIYIPQQFEHVTINIVYIILILFQAIFIYLFSYLLDNSTVYTSVITKTWTIGVISPLSSNVLIDVISTLQNRHPRVLRRNLWQRTEITDKNRSVKKS